MGTPARWDGPEGIVIAALLVPLTPAPVRAAAPAEDTLGRADALFDAGGMENRAEAGSLLERVSRSHDLHHRQRADRLLAGND